MIDQLTLGRPKETLDPSVVPAVIFAPPAGDETIPSEHALVARGGILTAAIRMMHESRCGSPIRQYHRQNLLRQLDH